MGFKAGRLSWASLSPLCNLPLPVVCTGLPRAQHFPLAGLGQATSVGQICGSEQNKTNSRVTE